MTDELRSVCREIARLRRGRPRTTVRYPVALRRRITALARESRTRGRGGFTALARELGLPRWTLTLYPELAQRAEQESLGYWEFLAILMAEEVAHRAQTRIQHCVRRAHFPFLKTIDEYDFTFQAAVRLSLLGSFLSPEFVTQGHGLVLSGASGTGKTHLAVAIAYRAIQNGFEALFTTATALIDTSREPPGPASSARSSRRTRPRTSS
jgi:hypothetical protein